MNDTAARLTIALAMVLGALHIVKRMAPAPYRLTQRLRMRLSKPLAGFLLMHQLKRRGLPFAVLVHFPTVLAVLLISVGITTGTYEALIAAILCATGAIISKRLLASLRRLRSQRRTLPGWRR